MAGISPASFYAAKPPAVDPPEASTSGTGDANSGRPITPPNPEPRLQSGATPITNFRDKSAPFTSQHEYRDTRINALQMEITGRVVGPVSGLDFLEFMPGGGFKSLAFDLKGKLASLSKKKKELEMYKPWADVMNQLCPDLMFADDHDQELTVLKGIIVKPDVNVYPFKAGSKHRSHVIRTIKTIEMMIEFKIDPADDPFEDKIGSFERTSKEAEKTLGQIAVYATAHQAAQFRTHVFSGLVFPMYMRLLRWDRSGVVVTEKLPLDDPHVIIFFQRFSDAHSEPQLRGHDTTVAEANLAEDLAARIREKLSCQPNSPLFAISIGDNKYIIAEPNGDAGAVAPTGRSTRCFKAYCMRNKRIVLLKDTWRVLWPTLKPEHETYETLHANGIQNIPQCFGGGDVGVKDTNHRTQTKSWASRYQIKLTLREFQHYRLSLQHMDRTLEDFTDVHEMVTAVRDASEAHRQAVVRAKVLHRDVSVGNIMITLKDDEMKGFLIDWDLCLDLTKEGAAQSERTGTWQFTAIRLLREHDNGETPVAQRVDDVESFLHVLTWMALRYTTHSLTLGDLASILRDNFDASYVTAGRTYITRTRASNLVSGEVLDAAKFANKGILTVLRSLMGTLRHRYKVPELTERRPTEDDIKEYEFAVQRQTKALKLLDKNDAWLPTLLTDHLDDDEIRWEPNHQKVLHEIETLTENGGGKRKTQSGSGFVNIKSSRRLMDTAYETSREILEHAADDL